MKPTVISSGSGENPTSHHHHPTGSNPTTHNVGSNTGGGDNNANTYPNSRQFPQFQTGFDFEPDDMDDIFSDAGLRSRLNRMRDPFKFTRRRRAAAPQEGSPTSTNSFFDHIPPEFRHYIPDRFGFSHRTAPQSPKATPQSPKAAPQSHPQQYYEAYVQPGSPTSAQPPQQKPKLCDAAIQTEDLNQGNNEAKEGKDLNQHGLRNTVDLGQKSPPEECPGPRSQSAPPPDADETASSQASASSSVPSGGFASADAYAFAQAHEQPKTFTQERTQGTNPNSPPHPPPRQNFPQGQYQQPQYQPYHQYQQHQQPQNQQSYYEQPQAQQQTDSPTSPGYVRTVPIFVEGRSEPVINKTTIPQQREQQPQSPHQSQPQQQVPRAGAGQKPGHPTPLNTKQQIPAENASQVPPQTPHTTECINKIQAIQRDVLNLMMKVEHFKGMRGDKEYMYLDEMLTRNLLKLDTIDTNGKESIRLARKEAIKCIQASITVLEAKAEENARNAQQAVINTTQAPIPAPAPSTECNVIPNAIPVPAPLSETQVPLGSTEKIEIEAAVSENNEQDEIPSKLDQNVAIPLPPPEGFQCIPQIDESTVSENVKEMEKDKKVDESAQERKPLERTEINIQIGPSEPTQIEKVDTDQVKTSESTTNTSTEETNKGNKEEPTTVASEEPEQKADKPETVKSKQKFEDSNDSEGGKSAGSGAVKKKIIKKKKIVPKDAGKSELSIPPTEKSSEETSKNVTENSEQSVQESNKT